MMTSLDFLRELNFPSVLLRLSLAVLLGGLLGMERSSKGRPAGFRTYILIALGAVLTMLLSQYEHAMLLGPWADTAQQVGIQTDVSRFGAQVINGIGFLGAGTIFVSRNQHVKGVTTAAGLWAAACMGLAIGAGFYECVLPAFVLILLAISVFPTLEERIVSRMRNMNVSVQFTSPEVLEEILECFQLQNIHVHEIDPIGEESIGIHSAIFYLRLPSRQSHYQILTLLLSLEGVLSVHEI